MKHYTLTTGSLMPAIGFGTSRLVPDKLEQAIHTALSAGFRHFDTAAIYGNETEVGAALNKGFSICSREEVWVTSKLWCDAHEPEHVLPALKDSLAKLQLDYVDLYLMHFPVALKRGVTWPRSAADFLTLEQVPLAATWQAMEQCVQAGLVKNIGVSNFSIKKLTDLFATARIKPAVNQIEIHPYQQEHTQRKFAENHNIVLTGYAPLGSKNMEMKTASGRTLAPLLTHPVILEIAANHNATPAQILIAWQLHIGAAPIPSSSTPERIYENIKAATLSLTEHEMDMLGSLHAGAKIFDAKIFTEHGSPYTLDEIWDGELYS